MPRIRRREWIGAIAAAAVLIGLLPAQAIAAPPSTGTSTPVDLIPIPAEKTAPESSTGAGSATETGHTTPTADPPSAATTTLPASSTGTVTFSGTQPAAATGRTSAQLAVYVKAATVGPRVVTVDATTVQAGSTPVSLGQATDVANAPAPTGTWQVAIADPTTGPAASVDGPVVSVTPPATSATPVDVVLDYTKFQDLYPADWSDRLTWVQLPACFLTTPDTDGCDDATVLDTTNDPTTHTIRASVTPDTTGSTTATARTAAQASGIHPASWVTPADTGTTPSVLAAVSSVSGAGGNFAATPLAQSGRWTAGSSSGGFQWTYDLQIPPAAGPAPKVAFSYSSQTVDGRTEVSSGQVSTIGEGWSYEPGHIERRYRTCSQDRDPVKDADGTSQTANNATHKTGDLCWASDNAVMTLNGSTIALVKDDKTGVWHSEGDDGAVITHSEPGGADTGEWVVTTRDGTKYHFGKVNIGGGHAATNSTGSVPVFGNHPGEPCYNASFDQSSCTQNWFWGLDLVEDTHGNAMVVDYTADTNYYARNNKFAHAVTYTRDVRPTKIEYGLRTDNLGATPQFHVDFKYATRCIDAGDACDPSVLTSKDPSKYNNWYDTPTNLVCTGEAGKQCHTTSPTFFSAWRMTGVSTWAPRADGVTRQVDGWALEQAFPQQWYDGTTPALWLKSITRTGYSSDGRTSQSTNPVQFQAATQYYLANDTAPTPGQIPTRVKNGGTDPRPTYARPRIGMIVTGTGEDIQVTYRGGCASRPDDSTASNNQGLCYPEHWSPGGDSDNPPLEWFNKYVVDQVLEIDASGSGHTTQMATHYDYNSSPAWARDDDEFTKPSQRTYSQWRGYASVTVRKGDDGTSNQTATTTHYFRGLDTDGTCTQKVTDYSGKVTIGCDLPEYQGMTAEIITFDASPGPRTVQSRQLSFPQSTLTASRARQGDTALEAHRVQVYRTDSIQTVSTGTRTVRTDTTYDTDGLPSTVQSSVSETDSNGTVTGPADYQCTVNTYTNNTSANLVGLPAEVRSTATSCADTDKATANQVIADARTFYDVAAGQFGKCTDTIAAPSSGLATDVCTIDGDGTSWIHSASTTYDSLGRVHTVTDAQQHATTTDYTPTTGAATSVKNTNTLNWTTTTTLDPGRGTTLSTTDPNQRTNRSTYDALGRLTAGYDPAHSGTSTPVVKYTYQQFEINGGDATDPVENAVTTSTLQDDGSYRDSVTIYDGLLRPIQTQAPAVGGGMLVTDTIYNDQGLTYHIRNGYYTEDATPSPQLFVPQSDYNVPNETLTAYDGLQRPVTVTTRWYGSDHDSTSTSYTGDSTTVTPPTGGTVARTWTDARGRTTELDQFTTSSGAAGAFNKTLYKYDGRGQRIEVDDPKGNTWTYTYDARGRVTGVTDPDTGTSHYTYDNLDQQLSSTDARGQSIWAVYDDLGRKTSIASGSAVGPELASWTYDTLPNGNPLKGQLTASSSYTGTTAYTSRITAVDTDYRPLGRDVVIPDTADTKGLSGTYHYDYTYTPTGKLQTETLPKVGTFSAETLVTRYNADGLPEATTGLAWYTSDTTYSPYGEVLRTVSGEWPNRVWTTNLVNQATRQLTEQVTDREQTAQHRLHDTKYTYDLVGNPLSIDDHAGAGTDDKQCFRYDYLGRLTEAWTSTTAACSTVTGSTKPTTSTLATGTDAYWESYGYDQIGNRKTLVQHQVAGGVDATKDASYGYNYGKPDGSQPHTLTELDATVPGTPTVTSTNTYGYDNSGNTTSRTIAGDTQNLTWNNQGQLDKVTGFSTGSGPVTLNPAVGVTKCLDVQSSATTDATPIQIYTCNGTEAQHWSTTGTTLRSLGKCAQEAGTGVAGDKIQLFTCNGAANQKWTQQTDGTFKNAATGLCIEDPASNSTDGTDVQANTCAAGTAQKWTVGTVTRYVYDASGNRILTIDATQTTLDLGEAEVRANHDGGITYTTRYYTQAGAPTVVRAGTGSQSLNVQLADPHGTTTTAVRIDTGNTTQDRKFLPYGDERGQKPAIWPDRTNFVGGTDESTSGLIHLGARDYDPATGRFTSADPLIDLGNPQQMNGYTYASGNPIGNSDPSGLMTDTAEPPCDQACQTQNEAEGTAANIRTNGYDPAHPKWVQVDKHLRIPVTFNHGNLQPFLDAYYAQRHSNFNDGDLDNPLPTYEYGAAVAACSLTKGACTGVEKAQMNALKGIAFEVVSLLVGGGEHPGMGEVNPVSYLWKKLNPRGEMSGGGPANLATDGWGCTVTNSFTLQTRVLLADGTTKPIGKLKPGDKVAAGDTAAGKSTAEQVVAVIDGHGVKKLTILTIKDGQGHRSTLTATDGHPFWLASKSTWLAADQLRPGDWLQTSAGTHVQIARVQHETRVVAVRNLTVAQLHTYYVMAGGAPVLVHNISCGPIPSDAYDILAEIDRSGTTPQGVRGPTEEFKNNGKNGSEILPRFDSKGNEITYREWGGSVWDGLDNPNYVKPPQGSGDPSEVRERIVTGSDGSAYFSPDHYKTFMVMRGGS